MDVYDVSVIGQPYTNVNSDPRTSYARLENDQFQSSIGRRDIDIVIYVYVYAWTSSARIRIKAYFITVNEICAGYSKFKTF